MKTKYFKDKLRIVRKSIPDNLNILFIAAFGSWNYGLQTETSDIDFKVVHIPTLEMLMKTETLKAINSIVNLGNVGQCEIIDIQTFIERIKAFDISKIEIVFAPYIWINVIHKSLFEALKRHTLNYILHNKVYYTDSVLATCNSIYNTFVASDVFNYNGKKAYNIPRLKQLLNYVLFDDEYNLNINDEIVHNNIMRYKLGITEKEDAKIECRVIIERMNQLKSQFSNESENEIEQRKNEFDEIVKNAVYDEIVKDKELKRKNTEFNKKILKCRNQIDVSIKLCFVMIWIASVSAIIAYVALP